MGVETRSGHGQSRRLKSVASPDSPLRESPLSSPAKRPASEMDAVDAMDVDRVSSETDARQTQKASRTAQDGDSAFSSSTPMSFQGSSTVTADESSAPTDVEAEESEKISIDEQVEMVHAEINNVTPAEGQVGYVVSRTWLGRVIARSKFSEEMGPFDKSCLEDDIGPVDNKDIIDEAGVRLQDDRGQPFVPLKRGLRMDVELHILPESAWNKIMKWYGLASNQDAIIRYQHRITDLDSALPAEWQYELYPPVFTIRKYQPEKPADAGDSALEAPRIVGSRSQIYMDFLKTVKKVLSIPLQTKVKMARVLEVQPTEADHVSSIPTPEASRDNSPLLARGQSLVMAESEYNALYAANQIEILDVKDGSMIENHNGRTNLDALGLGVDQTLVLFLGKNTSAEGAKRVVTRNLAVKDTASEPASSGRASPAIGMMTRGRNRTQGRTKGTVGLTNLGNTCYMNSALQCMRACQELSVYFLGNSWKRELNKENPLGHKGQIATVYADLLHAIYDGNQSSYTPRQFKTTLGRFAPVFAGYGQQDSQEFMSFLVDGLHEDLNRIQKKPYLENPDSDDETIRSRAALMALGRKYRENYEARNSSVITDLFNGFYKNKLVCPECNKVSITFDPYLLLTLQLPMEHYWEFAFTYVPLHGKPFYMYIDNEKGSTIKALKEYAASRTGHDADKLLMVEIFSHKIYRVMEDRLSIAEANMQQRDDMVIYELEDVPTNYPPKRRLRSMLDVDAKDASDGQVDNTHQLVMVLHRLPLGGQYHRNPVLWPTFIMLSEDEATDYDEILRKILCAVSNQTKRDLSEFVSSRRAKSPGEAGDAGEAGEPGEPDVVTRSVDDEPDYVDVDMNRGSPAIMFDKGSPIPDELTDLFEICYLHWADPIPTGFGQFDPSSATHFIKERIPKSESEDSDKSNTPESVDVSEESAQEDTERESATASYDAGETEYLKPGSSRNQRGRKGRKNRARLALKAKRNPRPFQRKVVPDHDVADGRLIRTNEIIVLDWNSEHFAALFEPKQSGDSREKMDVFDDPAKKKRAAQREARKRNGISLAECFEETAKEEILTEDNAWYCNRCKKLQLASKQLEIWTAPDVLVIHLKRFSSARQFRDKIDVLVDFPVEGLDIKDFVGLDEGKDLTYDLFGVDNHYGGIGGGHYTAYAKNFYDDEWHDYNDSSVTKRSPQSVVTPAAYLLFYRRRSDRPLGSPQLQRIVERSLDGEGDSDMSRSASPSNEKSGNDGRLDDSFRNGSSIALVGPVAAPPREAARSAGAPSLESRRMVDLAEDYTDLDEIPEGSTYHLMDDEGIGLNANEELHAHPTALHPTQPSWSHLGFSILSDELQSGDASMDRDEMDSNAAQGSEEDFNGTGRAQPYDDYDELNAQDDSMELLEAPRISSTPVNEESDIPQQSIEVDMDYQSVHELRYGQPRHDVEPDER